MRVDILASGSSGNCMHIGSGTGDILIDAGISMRRIQAGLGNLGLELDDISGVLITHEHSDHVSGLKMLAKHYSMPVYAPHTIANRLRGMLPELEPCLRIIRAHPPL